MLFWNREDITEEDLEIIYLVIIRDLYLLRNLAALDNIDIIVDILIYLCTGSAY